MILYCRLVVKSFAKNDSISDLELQKIDLLREWSTLELESAQIHHTPKWGPWKETTFKFAGWLDLLTCI